MKVSKRVIKREILQVPLEIAYLIYISAKAVSVCMAEILKMKILLIMISIKIESIKDKQNY